MSNAKVHGPKRLQLAMIKVRNLKFEMHGQDRMIPAQDKEFKRLRAQLYHWNQVLDEELGLSSECNGGAD